MNLLIILFGKTFSVFSKALNLGNGSTWPGHIALRLNKNFVKDTLSDSKTKIVVIAGTNGKTTTGKLINAVLQKAGKTTIHNGAGANLLNGLASMVIKGSNSAGKIKSDYLIFEADENALPAILEQISPDYIICLNLFRDQLDRYGEIDSIAKKWHEAFKNIARTTTLILNADDPQIFYLSNDLELKTLFFGLNDKTENKIKHGADSTYCPKCNTQLKFEEVFFSHLGIWKCPNCKLERPKPDLSKLKSYPLAGTYNKYNVLATTLFATNEGIEQKDIDNAFQEFKPAFGRGEKVTYKKKSLQIFLSKNPTSFNQSLQTIKDLGGKDILILLNDRIPDGIDVSWIWDINFEDILNKDFNIGISGDRVFDMAIRLKYAESFCHIEPNLEKILNKMTQSIDENETLYILANYSAMLDTRKILTGKKIL